MIPRVTVVGSMKGGVGKTTVARALVDYYKKTCRVYDTEKPKGNLHKFFPGLTTVVDMTVSEGQMEVFDSLKNHPHVLIDVQATMLLPILETMNEIGFMDRARAGSINLTTLHVMDGSVAAFDEIQPVSSYVAGTKYVVVRNHINNKAFINWPASFSGTVIDVPKLTERATEMTDVSCKPFSDFIADTSPGTSETLQGYVRTWLGRCYSAFDAAGLGVS